jgi:hypothetical protein
MDGFINLINNYLDLIFSTGAIWAIGYALVIFIIAACMGIYLESYVLRAVGLLVLAGTTYLMTPLAVTRLDMQYFRSFIIEFVGAFAILVLFESWLTEERDTFMPMAITTFLVASIFLAGAPYLEREVSIEFAVMLLGAFLTTILLKREWWWADSDPTHRLQRGMDKMFAKKEFAAILKEAEVHIKLTARSEDELEYRLSLLRHTFDILGQSDPTEDRKTGGFVVLIAAKIRADVQAPEKPTEGEVHLRIMGNVNLVKQATLRIGEIFTVSQSSQRHAARRGEVEANIQCSVPEVSLSDVMFEHFHDLALTWRDAAGRAEQQATDAATDQRKKAFYQGFARASQQSAKQLMDKIDGIGLTN